MFEEMINSIKEETVMFCYNVTVQTHTERKQVIGHGEGRKDEYSDDEAMMMTEGAPDEQDIPERENKPETVRRDHPKIGRNDPCPCGSGKKYKHCCGKDL